MHARWSLAAALIALSLAVPGVAAAGPSTGDALIFRTPSGDLKLFDSASRQPVRTLPPGVLSADGKTLLTAQVRGRTTLLRRVMVSSGRVIAHRTIPGRWSFQTAAADGTLVAGGDGAQPIALVTVARARGYLGDARTTRIALLPSDLAGELQVLTLRGNFGVDAVGPDAHYLYLVQHLVGEHYQVRAYDLLGRKLVAQPVVSKTEPNEKMQGLPLARAASPTGNMVLTLYRKPSGMPFVHALFANALYAVCIDLPASARVDPADPSSWGVALSGNQLYLANADTGWVAVVDYTSFKVLRTASLGAQTGTRVALRPLAASDDGSTLYLARPNGLIPIASGSLIAGAPLAHRAFGSVEVGSTGVLYAADGATTDVLDPHTGAAEGKPAATRGLTLVGVVKRFQH
jgi:hypothetical protein